MIRSKKRFQLLRDEDLMEHLCSGDQEAFDELYERYQKRVLYYFFRMLGSSKEKAMDFLQDLFLKLVEKPQLFDRKRKFSTWLFSVAHNMCKNEYRRLEVRKVMDPDAETDVVNPNHKDPGDTTDLKDFTQALYQALDNMEEDRKTAFLLRYREGFSIKEISEVLNCAEGTVKSKVFYTNKKLSLQLQAYNPGLPKRR